MTSFLISSPEAIEGIGRSRTEALADAGIETIAEMLAAGPSRFHRLFPKLSAPEVGKLFCAGVLLRIDGMTPDLAEAFVAADIRSVPGVAEAGLKTLEKACAAAVKA